MHNIENKSSEIDRQTGKQDNTQKQSLYKLHNFLTHFFLLLPYLYTEKFLIVILWENFLLFQCFFFSYFIRFIVRFFVIVLLARNRFSINKTPFMYGCHDGLFVIRFPLNLVLISSCSVYAPITSDFTL